MLLIRNTPILKVVNFAASNPMDNFPITPPPGRTGRASQRLRKIKKYIDENISGDLHAGAVSKKFNTSISSLHHLFQREEKMSYHVYLEEVRMKKAFELLKMEGMSVKEVMFASGYTYRTTFNSAFKKKFKYPPSHFKN